MYLWILLLGFPPFFYSWLLILRHRYKIRNGMARPRVAEERHCLHSVHLLYSDSYWVLCLSVSQKMKVEIFFSLSISVPWQSSFLFLSCSLCLVYFPLWFSDPKNAGSIAMLRVICRLSFKCLMSRWQTRSPAIHPGGQSRLVQGECLTFQRQITDAHRPWSRAPKGERINLPWQEGYVSLYTPNRNYGEGVKLVRAKLLREGRQSYRGKLKWHESTVVDREQERNKTEKETDKW